MTITWPPGLDAAPLSAGYRMSRLARPLLETEMDQGPARKRRRYPNRSATIQAVFRFTALEFETFRAWHGRDAFDGAAWVNVPIWTGSAYLDHLCRIAIDEAVPIAGGAHWRVSTTVEVRSLAAMDPTTLQAATAHGPERLLTLDGLLHAHVHTDWPTGAPA